MTYEQLKAAIKNAPTKDAVDAIFEAFTTGERILAPKQVDVLCALCRKQAAKVEQ